jgi:5-methylcytosine-specific restriction endonuclease McrBC regulatory subunit McrC
VEPKINTATRKLFEKQLEVDDQEFDETGQVDDTSENELLKASSYRDISYVKMLLDIMSDRTVAKECTNLVYIGWEKTHIKINHQDDQLTPFLIAQFLQLLKLIVRKGLKKSYYKEKEHLQSRVKGKILVSQHLKHNVFKQRVTKTLCEYQVFGMDNSENRFLKKAFNFAASYVDNNGSIFRSNRAEIDEIIHYCRPAFDQIGDELQQDQLNAIKQNPFFKEYAAAVRVGGYILKKFAYNIVRTTDTVIDTPPFWIDMPKLFELYVYQKLLLSNNHATTKIKYQFSTYGNALDILVKDGAQSMVIDAKYKLHYKHSQVHDDMRQVAGYARLTKLLMELSKNNTGFDSEAVPPCLIVYPDMENGLDLAKVDIPRLEIHTLLNDERRIKSYYEIYKVGIKLPMVDAIN